MFLFLKLDWLSLPGRWLKQRLLKLFLFHILLEVLEIDLFRVKVMVDDLGSFFQVAFHLIVILGELWKLIEHALLSASLDIDG